MGTNYYAIEPCEVPCQHCDPPEWHICKSLRTFRSHDDTPWGTIRSWQDWKSVLNSGDVIVVDEYGAEHDIEQFITDVEAVPVEDRRRQYEWVIAHPSYRSDRYFLDSDQFSFCTGDFS